MRIGIIRYWIGRAAAEHEVVERIKKACEILGHDVVELRADGLMIDGAIPSVDLVLNLHFASGKCTPHLTYGALWNPWRYYAMWDFKTSFANQISNDFLISCGSEKIDRKFTAAGLPKIIKSHLNHTVPEIYSSPEIRTDRKLFYIGINWEKNSNSQGRHHKLLKILDNSGFLEIYGPKRVGEVKPWSGFKSYKGELPFDGKAVLETASKLGVVLVLSSKEHEEDEIMSNRLFEGIASGAAIIGDNHTFITKNFAKSVWQIDNKQCAESQAQQILKFLEEINCNPQKTTARIMDSQQTLTLNYSLVTQIEEITNHAREVLSRGNSQFTKSSTAIIFDKEQSKIQADFFQNLVLAGFTNCILLTSKINQIYPENLIIHRLPEKSTYFDFFLRYSEIEDNSEFVAFFTGQEEVFPNYLQTLNEIEDSHIGEFVTGVVIESNAEKYAKAINPLSADINNQYLSGLILRRSKYLEFMQEFRNVALHTVVFYMHSFLINHNLVRISSISRFRVNQESARISHIEFERLSMLIDELKSNPYITYQIQWCNDLASEIKIRNDNLPSIHQNQQVIQFIYRQLRLPQFLKKLLKKFVMFMLRF